MRKRIVKGLEVEISSGNVFADLGLRNVEKLKIKSGLVIQIIKAVRRLGLSQEEAGRRMGLPQPKVSGLFRGDFANVSERKLMDCLSRLGYDIEIKVKPAAGGVGHVKLAAQRATAPWKTGSVLFFVSDLSNLFRLLPEFLKKRLQKPRFFCV